MPEQITLKQVLNLALNMKELRKAKGYTQLDLAVHLSCSESFISGIECANYRDISLLMLNKISKLFDVSIVELLKAPV